MARKGFSPAWVLFFLSPAIAELLSGSAPPREFFNPVGFSIIAALYGSGAVIARELTVRWGKGWPALLCLGAAYGILEEGLAVKSFFDPNWMDLGILGTYGRWAGVNWVWSLELTIYHAVFSIAVPAALVMIIFPQRRTEPWVSRGGLRLLYILLAADTIFCLVFLTPYRPAPVALAGAALVAALAVFLARRVPGQAWADRDEALASGSSGLGGGPPARARWFALAGFTVTTLFFLINWGVPRSGLSPLGTMLLTLGLVAGAAGVVRRLAGRSRTPTLSDRRLWALVSGALGFFIVLAPLQELDPTRSDSTKGMTVVGLACLLLLGWVARRRGFGRPRNTG
jgi:hypothetical protein